MTLENVSQNVRFVIGRIADAILVTVGASVIAPEIALMSFAKLIGSKPAGLDLIGGLPDLVGVIDEIVPDEYILFGTVAHVDADVICADRISLEPILRRLLDKQASVMARNEVPTDAGAVHLLQEDAVASIRDDVVVGDE